MNCAECDAELELDEPQQCYFTGRGSCGDCTMNCFHPVLCDACLAAPVPTPTRREIRRQEILDQLATKDYRERIKEQRRSTRSFK